MRQFYTLLAAFLLAILLYLPALAQENAPPLVPRRDASGLAQKIYALHEKILSEGRTVNQISEESLSNLPIGITSNVGGLVYLVAIDSMVFTPQGAFFNAYLSLELPISGEKIAFAALNIPFQPGGLSAAVSNARLALVQDYSIKLSNQITLNLPTADRRNFIEWDCNGFKSLNVKGEFEFSDQLIVPEQDGKRAPGRVKATFETAAASWNDLITKVTLPPFQIAGLDGFSFQVQEAFVDYSDVANPAGIVFPAQEAYLGGAMPDWNGFYLKTLTVKLPEALSKRGGRIAIDAQHLLIDNRGVSGMFGAKGLFGPEDGDLNGWPFSMDSLGVAIQCNKLSGAAFKGLLNVPLFDKEDPLRYSAQIASTPLGTQYLFSCQPSEDISAGMLGATITLAPATTFRVTLINGKLVPEANLTGTMSVAAPLSGGSTAAINNLAFQELVVSSQKPYLRSGTFALSSGVSQKLAGFTMTIDSIGLGVRSDQLVLSANVKLGLMEGGNAFSGKTRLHVFGKMEEVSEGSGEYVRPRQEWKYDKTVVSKIEINAHGAAFEIKGSLDLYREDPVYGNGFRGAVTAKFKPIKELSATAQFGNVNGMRYWYVDAKAILPNAMPIATGFGMYGFGGGLYYKMRLQQLPGSLAAAAPVTATQASPQPGATSSGMVYVPDAGIALGLKASVTIGTMPLAEAFNADATFEMAFNTGGGLRYINFRGDGYFMTKLEKRSGAAPLYAGLNVNFDNTNDILHATLDTYVNVPGVLRGVNQGGLAGQAVLHFEPSKWYIHVGTPAQRMGVEFVGLVKTGSYFVTGTEIPAMPDLPGNVTSILGDMDLSMSRNEGALRNGAGFAFGSNLQISTGQLTFLMFYGQFDAGMGFDIMLKNYGQTTCYGRTGRVGMNGWYASGQAYAYVQGKIGIGVKTKFVKGNFDILNIGAAAVLQAQLPNPTWLQGVVGGQFSILGGLVKGNCKFKVTIGEKCQFENGAAALDGIKVIAQISPGAGENDISVFNAPQVAFNIAVDKPFETLDANNNPKAYKAKLDHFQVLHNGKALPGTLEWNEGRDVAVFNTTDILPAATKVTVVVQVHWEEKVNGVWKPLNTDGEVEKERMETIFTTGAAPQTVEGHNVKYSYPLAAQQYFLKSEYPTGYLQLKKGQDSLFLNAATGPQYKFVARFSPADGSPALSTALTYDTQADQIRFSLPAQLVNEKKYTLQLVKQPASEQNAIDQNVTASEKTLLASAEEGGRVTTSSKTITGTVELAEEKVLYQMNFATSRYNTFQEKMTSFASLGTAVVGVPGYNLFQLALVLNGAEPFDDLEQKSNVNQKDALLQLEMTPDNAWYRDFIAPLLYNQYPPENGIALTWEGRSTEIGVPPLKALYMKKSNAGNATFVYDLEYYAFMDYRDLSQKLANRYAQGYSGITPAAYNILTTNYRYLPRGTYSFKVSYALPGVGAVTAPRTLSASW